MTSIPAFNPGEVRFEPVKVKEGAQIKQWRVTLTAIPGKRLPPEFIIDAFPNQGINVIKLFDSNFVRYENFYISAPELARKYGISNKKAKEILKTKGALAQLMGSKLQDATVGSTATSVAPKVDQVWHDRRAARAEREAERKKRRDLVHGGRGTEQSEAVAIRQEHGVSSEQRPTGTHDRQAQERRAGSGQQAQQERKASAEGRSERGTQSREAQEERKASAEQRHAGTHGRQEQERRAGSDQQAQQERKASEEGRSERGTQSREAQEERKASTEQRHAGTHRRQAQELKASLENIGASESPAAFAKRNSVVWMGYFKRLKEQNRLTPEQLKFHEDNIEIYTRYRFGNILSDNLQVRNHKGEWESAGFTASTLMTVLSKAAELSINEQEKLLSEAGVAAIINELPFHFKSLEGRITIISQQSLAKLGKGAYGTVTKCIEVAQGVFMAMKKTIGNETASSAAEESADTEIRREYTVLKAQQANTWIGVGTDKRLFRVEELMDDNLYGVIGKPQAYDLPQRLQLCRDILDDYYYKFYLNGFTHRDLKPANIAVKHQDGKLNVRIIDVASAVNRAEGEVNILGFTPLYSDISTFRALKKVGTYDLPGKVHKYKVVKSESDIEEENKTTFEGIEDRIRNEITKAGELKEIKAIEELAHSRAIDEFNDIIKDHNKRIDDFNELIENEERERENRIASGGVTQDDIVTFHELNEKHDVFSLGIIFYQLLTGQFPTFAQESELFLGDVFSEWQNPAKQQKELLQQLSALRILSSDLAEQGTVDPLLDILPSMLIGGSENRIDFGDLYTAVTIPAAKDLPLRTSHAVAGISESPFYDLSLDTPGGR